MKTLMRWLFDRPLKKGTVLEGRYRINRVLGMGSYGITYLAEELGRSGFRVIKQQRKTKAWTSAGRRSFNREAEILRELDLPAAPRIYEVLQAAGERFIVMEYIEGKTFEDLLFYDGHVFDEQQTISILKEVLHSVSFLHRRGIIHRDLRIPNLIVSGGTIRIIDFGLACHLTERERVDDRHPEKRLMRAVSVKSDFYALGHFALFLLYSEFTPSGEEEKSWEEELCLSSGFTSVLRKMLQIDQPYERAEDIIGDLTSCTAKKMKQPF
ncbi:protein kinase [Bacillus paralicheniformis]|uniref:Protein kinase n=1 Tax=Bacillus paralicheniformis TaxID=1648923 RepID=A0AAW6KB92_9BACI|nr:MULTISPECIES: protein kinase [Bacillus]KJD55641.1 protein kinase [Bacillus amyloliquefaciens]MBC8622915.1 protein kinase [Robertmurraya crescens]AJO16535.1 tyrosine protein kinase [Bacillus paralicheniformis]AYQ14960.1 protein kinase [Bacillus paralicheniformis]KRT91187.1 protein kinase [Bacillus paralicheniformis]